MLVLLYTFVFILQKAIYICLCQVVAKFCKD